MARLFFGALPFVFYGNKTEYNVPTEQTAILETSNPWIEIFISSSKTYIGGFKTLKFVNCSNGFLLAAFKEMFACVSVIIVIHSDRVLQVVGKPERLFLVLQAQNPWISYIHTGQKL